MRPPRRVPLGALILGLAIVPVATAQEKLSPSQREAVKRAQWHAGEAEKRVPEIAEAVAAIRTSENPSAIPFGKVQGLVGQVESLQQSLENASTALQGMPADHPEVAPLLAKVQDISASVGAHAQATSEILAQFEGYRNIANYPEYAPDLERLRGLAEAYSASFNFLDNPDRTRDLGSRWQEAIAWHKANFEKYKPLMQQKTGEGNAMYSLVQKFAKGVKEFQARCQEIVNEAPGKVDGALAQATSFAERAVAEKKPAFFEGGIEQQMGIARSYGTIYSAIVGDSDEKSLAIASRIEEVQSRIDQARAALDEEIVASTQTPADLYRAADRDHLRGVVEEAWRVAWPDDEILGIRFHVADWKTDAGYEWSRANERWEAYDRSLLPVSVVVKTDDQVATIYPAYLNRDNLSASLVPGVQTKGSEYVVRRMLLVNHKP